MASVAMVMVLPSCDLCKAEGIDRVARVDGQLRGGRWAFQCEEHWATHGIGKLGSGLGQLLESAQ